MKHLYWLTILIALVQFSNAQVFFSEDFESITSPTLPNNWTVITQASDGGYTTGNHLDANSAGSWTVPMHTQFAMTNDDACNCNKSNDYLVLPIQDFSMIVGGIDLEAAVHNDGNFGGSSMVMVSVDTGNTWTPVDTLANNTAWQNITVSLNAYIGIPHVMIAFHFTDGGFWTTGLAVDDVVLRQVSGFSDLALLQHQQEYTQIPLSQVINMPLAARVRNQGTTTALDATLTTEIYQSPNFATPIQTLTSLGDTLTPAQIKVLSSGTFLPTNRGVYLFKHIISTTSFVDGNALNDTLDFTFEITDSTYSRDNNSLQYSIDNPGFGNSIEVGQLFDVQLTATMSSVTFAVEGANIGDTATITVYNTNMGAPASPISSYDYPFVAKGIQYITIPTNDILAPGTYFLAIKENTTTDTLGILGSNSIYTPNKSFLSLNGNSFVDMAGQGYPAALILRPNLNIPCPTIVLNPTPITCNGDNNGNIAVVTANGTPPFSYNWSNNSSATNIQNLAPGTYTLTLTDANNCVVMDSIELLDPPVLVGGDTTVPVTCGDSCNGIILAMPSGGTFPYYYQWDANANNSINAYIDGLCVGMYNCTVTDFRGCTITMNPTVGIYSPIDSIVATNVTMSGGNDGSATLYYHDSTWTYQWSTGDTLAIQNNLTAGWYYITATDTLGCTYIDSVEITDPPLSVVSLNQEHTIRVYPNPSSGKVFIQLNQAPSIESTITVLNALGQELDVAIIQQNQQQFQLNLAKYQAGLYWIRIHQQGKIISRAIVLL